MLLQNQTKAIANLLSVQVIKNYGILPLFECYGGLISQVFMNLLSYAIDALETCRMIEDDRTHTIIITTNYRNERVYISIADNGAGIRQENINQLFSPFFTTKLVGTGTGLGLAISYEIITEKHGGTIDFISTRHEGTTFSLCLPCKHLKTY